MINADIGSVVSVVYLYDWCMYILSNSLSFKLSASLNAGSTDVDTEFAIIKGILAVALALVYNPANAAGRNTPIKKVPVS